MFLLDKNKFVHNFLPPRLRKAKHVAWVKVIVWHVFELWNELYLYYNLIVADLTKNIATDVFQQHLRNLYPDVGLYKCFVKNQYDTFPTIYTHYIGEHHLQTYTYQISEAQPVKIVTQLDERVKDYDYIVVIPTAYSSSVQDIIFLCNKYKPSGKRYLLNFSNITV